MKLVTFRTDNATTCAGIVFDQHIVALKSPDLLALLRDHTLFERVQAAFAAHSLTSDDLANAALAEGSVLALPANLAELCDRSVGIRALADVVLLPPVPEPPTMRDFYAFEQHVKTARSHRGLDMIPEWYEIPTFYFTNTSEIYGQNARVPYPLGSQELDFELEIACVIGREGKNISIEEAEQYIAGYTIMNDWSARDFQRKDMKLNLGPGKGKDFATSLGPWMVTPDELASRRIGSGERERYDMTMLARVNGREISRGNFKDIYYSFPQMIAWASRNVRLRAGDVLGSGTVGTGCILELGTKIHRWLQRGDIVELEIEGIGVLRNTIV
jgi:fumarylacetoacetate (FAA) hydrolase